MTCQTTLLSEKLNIFKDRINQALDSIIIDQDTPYQKLFEATRYSLLAPGKRIRGALALATVDALGEDHEKALFPACALEMIHTASLIHDDLPCMDDDDLRRGRPTLHKAYPEWLALLSGDYLLTKAFETLSQAPGINNSQRIQLIKILSSRSGAHGLTGGQVMDILQEEMEVPLSHVEMTHQLKTAALISAACEFAGVICSCSPEEIAILRGYGQKVGLAFQIIDDVLDVQGDTATLGKPVGSDINKNKNTYITQLGVEGSMDAAQKLIEQAIDELKALNLVNESLQELANYVLKRMY